MEIERMATAEELGQKYIRLTRELAEVKAKHAVELAEVKARQSIELDDLRRQYEVARVQMHRARTPSEAKVKAKVDDDRPAPVPVSAEDLARYRAQGYNITVDAAPVTREVTNDMPAAVQVEYVDGESRYYINRTFDGYFIDGMGNPTTALPTQHQLALAEGRIYEVNA